MSDGAAPSGTAASCRLAGRAILFVHICGTMGISSLIKKEQAVAKIIVEVCAGTHCVLMGSMNIMDAVHSLEELRRDLTHPCEVELLAIPCMNLCKEGAHGPFVRVDGQLIEGGESENVMAAIMDVCMNGNNKQG